MYSNSFFISFILNKIQSLLGELQKIEELIKARDTFGVKNEDCSIKKSDYGLFTSNINFLFV
jgi:hypothetical protein